MKKCQTCKKEFNPDEKDKLKKDLCPACHKKAVAVMGYLYNQEKARYRTMKECGITEDEYYMIEDGLKTFSKG